MAGARGYSSYRGRGSKWKVLMAIVLVLVIAVAASVIYLEQFIVYSADGRRHIDLPWQTEDEGAVPPPEGQGEGAAGGVDVVVQEPEDQGPKETVALSLPAQPLRQSAWGEFDTLAFGGGSGAYNAAAIRLKTSNGTIYFDSANAVPGAVEVVDEAGGDPQETAIALGLFTSQEGLHTIASMACLQDFKAANADVEGRGLKNTGGYIFYDGNNSLWLDPAKPATRAYVCALAKEIAELGFDELLLTDLSYPTVGKIPKIAYNTEVPLANNLDLLLSELGTALEPYDILLSVEVPEAVISEGPDTVAGLDLSRLAARVDRIYAVTTPEEVEALSALVAQAAGDEGGTEFVPELAEDPPAMTGSRLILAG
ncbi:putative glycoside hydrolase [uncultured Oscillibacter sp.]|uniref:putative glycoside hydrolase n=1 Tax=uncultured Oscillibacter sp. TaxID=876091 RepID=UPI0025F012D6|nr:putative glycoside hydrolase [uncultured Oscillibacter sp.]